MFIAVVPVTRTDESVSALTCAPASRMPWTRSSVVTDDGLESGTTVIVAVSPSLLKLAGVTVVTSLRALILSVTVVTSAFGVLLSFASTTTISGPLKPGPKPSDSRS